MIRGTTHQPTGNDITNVAIALGKAGLMSDTVVAARQALGIDPSTRQFSTGATRDADTGKIDFDGFLSPLTLRAYGEYMHGHRKLPDGSLRASDNWQLGIDRDVYMKSLWRHFFAVWEENKGIETPDGLVENLCAVLFNASGMLHEVLKSRRENDEPLPPPPYRCADYPFPLADPED